MSLSSDQPVDRWFGEEVLDHSAAAIDLSRAKRGLPLLFNHDTAQIIGRIEDIGLRKDGKLGGLLRLAKNAKAREVAADIEDGILTDMSIGYRINDWVESKTDGTSRYTATNWTPLEGSIVAVPADHTVGVGRSAELAAAPAITKTAPTGEEARMAESAAPAAGEQKAVVVTEVRDKEGLTTEERTRLLASTASHFKMETRLAKWISEGFSLEQARQDIEAETIRKAGAQVPTGHVDLSAKETAQYNISRAILAVATGTWQKDGGLEREVSDAVAQRTGKPSRGLYIPMNLQTRTSVTGNIVGTSSLGGAAVQTTLLSLIEILRNRIIVRQAGARFLTGLTDTISFPRQITANTFNWTGENPSSANSLGSLTLNNLTLSPKTGMVSTAYSRQLLVQSSVDAQNLVLDDIAQVIAVGVDSAAINGTGSNNQPTGVRNTASIGNRTLGTNGAAITWANLVGLETDVAVGNADLGSLGYLTNATQRGVLKTTLKNTVAGSLYMWEGGNQPGSVNGYNAWVSNQVPSNLTQGTSTTICSSIIFGNWAELLVGEWGGAVDLIVDPYTGASQNMIYVTGITMVDAGVRHAASFSKTDAAL